MEKIVQTAGRNALGEFSPEFAHFNDDVLFGENFCRKNTVQNHHLVHRLEIPSLLHARASLPLRMANLLRLFPTLPLQD